MNGYGCRSFLKVAVVPNEESKKSSFGYREITVKKAHNQTFGAHFCSVSKHLCVARVDCFGADYQYSPAYRMGLRFGDRIHVVNGVTTSSETNVYKLEALLKAATDITIGVDDRPETMKVAISHKGEDLGIEFVEGEISSIEKDSLCYHAGFKVRDTVVQINNYCVLGMCDKLIMNTIKKAIRESPGYEVRMVVMSPMHANQLMSGLAQIMDDLYITNRTVYQFVNDTLSLDPYVDEDYVERIYVKEDTPKSKRLVKTGMHGENISSFNPAVSSSNGENIGSPKPTVSSSTVDGNCVTSTTISVAGKYEWKKKFPSFVNIMRVGQEFFNVRSEISLPA